ncbi:MAG: universal stress protein [Balneolaceae bacterium]|jgi:nucleotide-binding universal stress UspA family protein|nr:universal stress protein [Balneolaceae bacterium]
MIKRILIALDPDDDTPVATQYAIALAKKFDASVTGLAVVDTSNIYPTGIMGEPDITHHARNLWEELSDESRDVAKRLLDRFQETVESTGIRFTAIQKEGASYDRIIEGMKYHDILVVGRDSHFFYNEPKRETKTLAQVVKHGVSPTLVVMDRYKEVKKVLVAFDGSNPSARSLKGFVHLMPYGKELEIELLHIRDEDPDNENDESVLDYAEHYLKEHEFTNISKVSVTHKKPSEKILEHQKETGADLIILGAHAVSAIKRLTFGSNTHDLITKSDTPLFLSP